MGETVLRRGDRVRFRDAGGKWHKGRALGALRMGRDFPVIPVCNEATWQEEEPPDELAFRAWPATDVETFEEKPDG